MRARERRRPKGGQPGPSVAAEGGERAGVLEGGSGKSVDSGIQREAEALQDQQGDGEKARQIPADGKANILDSGRVWQ